VRRPAQKIRVIQQTLDEEIKVLTEHFLNKHLNTSKFEAPDQYKYDVKAFTVLSHAALEQAFEDVVELIAESAVWQYRNYRTYTPPLISMMSFLSEPLLVKTTGNTLDLDPFTQHMQSLQRHL